VEDGGEVKVDHVVDGHGADGLLAESDGGEERQGVKRVAEVIEHVVAEAVDHTGLENGVVEAGGADEFFGDPLGFVIGRAAIGAGTQEAEQEQAGDARAAGGVDDVRGAVDVDGAVGLRADLAIDSGAVSDGVAAGKGLGERRGIGKIGGDEGGAGESANSRVAEIAAAGYEDGVVAGGREGAGEVASDESGGSGDGDSHARLLWGRRLRCAIWVGQTALRNPLRAWASDSGWSW
jgi:hypothetical protein